MTTTPPPALPPPPPWDDLPPPGPTEAETASPDPTPILSAIGQTNLPTWGDDRTRLVRLQGLAVAWNFQWFSITAIAAPMPWVLGRTGVLWSVLLMAVVFGGGIMQTRFIRKRGVVVKVMVTKANRRQALIRMALWESLIIAWSLGIVAAVDPSLLPVIAVVIAVTLVFVTIVLVRRSRQNAAALQSGAQDLSPPNGDTSRG